MKAAGGKVSQRARRHPRRRPLRRRRRPARRLVRAVPQRRHRPDARGGARLHARPRRLARTARRRRRGGLRLLRGAVRLDEGRGHGHGPAGHLPDLRDQWRVGRRHDDEDGRHALRRCGCTTCASTDIDAAMARAKDAGGKLLMDTHEVPGGMWISQFLDPQGAMFAMVGPRR